MAEETAEVDMLILVVTEKFRAVCTVAAFLAKASSMAKKESLVKVQYSVVANSVNAILRRSTNDVVRNAALFPGDFKVFVQLAAPLVQADINLDDVSSSELVISIDLRKPKREKRSSTEGDSRAPAKRENIQTVAVVEHAMKRFQELVTKNAHKLKDVTTKEYAKQHASRSVLEPPEIQRGGAASDSVKSKSGIDREGAASDSVKPKGVESRKKDAFHLQGFRAESPSEFLANLENLPFFCGQAAFVWSETARAKRCRPPTCSLPRALEHCIRQVLRIPSLSSLYEHQARAIDLIVEGKDVVVSTSTSSGKSLIYLCPILKTLAEDAESTSILLFPTKALAQDQLRNLRALVDDFVRRGGQDALRGNPHVVCCFDGDTPKEERSVLIKHSRIFLTNPDMLNATFLPRHSQFGRIFRNLKVLVVDEAHYYTGTFGIHTSFVLRRLTRICDLKRNGSFRKILLSATIGNAKAHAENLTGSLPFTVVDQDTAPRGERHVILWNPPEVQVLTKLRTSMANKIMERQVLAKEVEAASRRELRVVIDVDHDREEEPSAVEREGALSTERSGLSLEASPQSSRRRRRARLMGQPQSQSAVEAGVSVRWDASVIAAARDIVRRRLMLYQRRRGGGATGEQSSTFEEETPIHETFMGLSSRFLGHRRMTSVFGDDKDGASFVGPGTTAADLAQSGIDRLLEQHGVNDEGGGVPGSRSSTIMEACRLFAALVGCGLRTIAFGPARSVCEILLEVSRDFLRELQANHTDCCSELSEERDESMSKDDGVAEMRTQSQDCLGELKSQDELERIGDGGFVVESAHEQTTMEITTEGPNTALSFVNPDLERDMYKKASSKKRHYQLPAVTTKLYDRIRAYRAGYASDQRRQIERELANEELLGVCATNALELGVDIGSLDATVIVGVPGRHSTMWQQIGRAGRGGRSSVHFIVAQDSPLDQWFVRNPKDLFERKSEDATIDLDNTRILQMHLLAAAKEAPLTEVDVKYFGDSMRQCIADMETQGFLRGISASPQLRRWLLVEPQAVKPCNLRSVDNERIRVYRADTMELMEEMELWKSYFHVHPGAIHKHQGNTFVVEELDLEKKEALMSPVKVKYYTRTRDVSNVIPSRAFAAYELLKGPEEGRCSEEAPNEYRSDDDQRDGAANVESSDIIYAPAICRLAKARVDFKVFGYKKIDKRTGKVLELIDMSLPSIEYDTECAHINVPLASKLLIDRENRDFRAGVHAANHAILSVVPLFVAVDASDVATECFSPFRKHFPGGRLMLFEKTPGGVGVVKSVFAKLPQIVKAALDLIQSCPCGESDSENTTMHYSEVSIGPHGDVRLPIRRRPFRSFERASAVEEASGSSRVRLADEQSSRSVDERGIPLPSPGCPLCVQLGSCKYYNEVMDKTAGIVVLRGVLSQLSQEEEREAVRIKRSRRHW